MAGDITFGIRLTADATGFIGTVRLATQEIDKLRGTAGQTNSTLKQMQTESQGLTTQMVALGVAIGDLAGRVLSEAIHGMVEWTKETVHAAAALSDLSTATGSSVEDLSRLTNSFKISGVSSDLLATALQRLSVGLSGADAESKLAGDTLNKLGITARDPAVALQELANKLEEYADGANKAALVQAILGRGAQVLIPALHDLATATGINASVTAQQAAEAEKLEKQWRALGTQAGVLKTALLSDLVPALSRFITGIQLARAEGLGWFDSLNVGTTYADRVVPSMQALSKEIDNLKSNIVDLKKQGRDWLIPGLQQELDNDTAKMRVLIALRNQLILQNVAAMGFTGDARDLALANQKPQAPNPFAAVTAGADEAAKAMKEARDELSRAQVEFDNLSLSADQRLTPAILKLIQASQDPAFQKLTATQRQSVVNTLLEANAVEVATAKYKELVDALNAVVDLDTELEAKQLALTDAIKQAGEDAAIKNDQLVRENALIGQSDTAHQLLAADIEYETQVRKLATQAVQAYTVVTEEELQALKDQLAIRKQLINEGGIATEGVKAAKAYAEEWKRALDTVQHGVADFLVDFVEHGSSAFKNLWANFKHWALQALADIAAKQVIVSVTGAVGLSAAGGAGASALSGSGGSAASGLVSGLAGNIGVAVGDAIFGVGGGAALTAGLAANFATLGIAAEAGAAAVGGLGVVVAAAIPVVGLFIAAAYLAYQYFSQAKGGPKQGGSYNQGIAGFNDYPGETNAANNAAVQAVVANNQQTFQGILNAIGGHGSALFALSYDTDPEGTAPSRVSSSATVGGQSVYSARDVNAGRDDASIQAALKQESERAILAALKASELPQVVADYLKGIDVNTATTAQIEDAITKAIELYNVTKGLAQLDLKGLDIEALKGFQLAGETLGQTFQRVGGAYTSFLNAFTSDSEKLQNAQNLVTNTFAQLGIAVPENDGAFLKLVQGIDLSTDAGREMFSTLITIAPAFQAVEHAADEAAIAAKKLADSMTTATSGYAQAINTHNGGSAVAGDQIGLDAAIAIMANNVPGVTDLNHALHLTADELAHLTPEQIGYITGVVDASTKLNSALQAEADAAKAAAEAARQYANQLISAASSYAQAVSKYNGGSDAQSAAFTQASAFALMVQNVPGVQSLNDALSLTADQLAQLTPEQLGYITAFVNAAHGYNDAVKAETDAQIAAAEAARQYTNSLWSSIAAFEQSVLKHNGASAGALAQFGLDVAWDTARRNIPDFMANIHSLGDIVGLTADQLAQLTPEQIGYLNAIITSSDAVDAATDALKKMNEQLVHTYEQATARFRAPPDQATLLANVAITQASMSSATGLYTLSDVLSLTNEQWLSFTDTQRASILTFLTAEGALEDFNKQLAETKHQAAEAALALRKTLTSALADIRELANRNPLAEGIAANGSQWDKLTAQGDSLATLTANYDGTAQSTQALTQATKDYHNSLVAMISTIETLKGSIAALFNSNIRDFTLDGLDKQGQYAYLQNEVAQAMEELKTATDPARINALAQLIAGDQKQAYGLLDPDQKNSVRAEFIAGAQAANDLLQQRLQAAEDAAEKRNAQLVQDIKDAFTEIVTKFDKPAQKLEDASNTALVAANTPKQFNITVDVADGGSAVGTYP